MRNRTKSFGFGSLRICFPADVFSSCVSFQQCTQSMIWMESDRWCQWWRQGDLANPYQCWLCHMARLDIEVTPFPYVKQRSSLCVLYVLGGGSDMSCHINYVTQWGQVSSIHSTVQQATFMRPGCQFCSQWLLILLLKCTWCNPCKAQSSWQRCLGLSRDQQAPFPVEFRDITFAGFFALILIIYQISAIRESKIFTKFRNLSANIV